MAQFRTVFSALVIAIALEACNDMAMKKEASLNDRLAGKAADEVDLLRRESVTMRR